MKEIINTKTFPKALRTEFEYLCRPIDLNFSMPIYHNHVLSDGQWWWATDGKRLHGIDLDDFRDKGVYEVLMKTKRQIIMVKTDKSLDEFPNIIAAFPKHDKYKTVDCYHGPSSSFTNIIRAMKLHLGIRYEFVNDIMDTHPTAYIYDHADQGIAFESHNRVGLIMPSRAI